MEEQNYKFSKPLLTLTIIGAVKLILAFVLFLFYISDANYIMSALATWFIMFEVATDMSTWFLAQPIIVLVLSVIICFKRHSNEKSSKTDYLLTVICAVVWVIAGLMCRELVMIWR